MNQTIWAFRVQFSPTTSAENVYLTEAAAQNDHAIYVAGGYTVSDIFTEVRYVDPVSGTIGGTPAATQSVAQQTVVNQSAIPSGSPVPGSAGVWSGGPAQSALIRFIFSPKLGVWDTGANYPGCASTNTPVCDPQEFGSLYDAVQYALGRRERPYLASSVEEVWAIIDTGKSPNPAQFIDPATVPAPVTGNAGGILPNIDPMLLALGAVAAVIAFGGRGRRAA